MIENLIDKLLREEKVLDKKLTGWMVLPESMFYISALDPLRRLGRRLKFIYARWQMFSNLHSQISSYYRSKPEGVRYG